MTKTNRFLNRLLIGLVGLLLLAGGLLVLATTIPWPWRDQTRELVGRSAAWASGQVQQLADSAGLTPESVFAAICLVLGGIVVIVAVVVLFTRGGGRTKVLSERRSTSQLAGGVVLEAGTAAQVLRAALLERPDVVHVGSGSYRVRRRGVLVLRVQLRSGAAIGEVVATAEDSARGLDVFLGEQPPIVLEIVEGTRARLSGDTRTAAVSTGQPVQAGRPSGGHAPADAATTVDGDAVRGAEPVGSGATA
ncbi:hypothetical protein [Mycetocola reblochoni]|uniref:Uncharacterized protein n=2 Tax=Mycetocola reblochoni TaxID=331618 RepID=A0A1R4JG64_9MICO|nr:hypothetical protein [Mycetocola reblochoni]RLP68244.1 hypothetical protein D9V30_11095 [Mycetocola reblochoni]SJN31191.1 hypothetical protein FM119_07445 [Mycetocola reblochoni REB411]